MRVNEVKTIRVNQRVINRKGEILYVQDAEGIGYGDRNPKILCSDWKWYGHRELKKC